MTIFLLVCSIWLLTLAVVCTWKYSLLRRTWQEVYFAESPVLIESDDWGPGDELHAQRLLQLCSCLLLHKDAVKRSAVLTANMVLSVPDIAKITADRNVGYHRQLLNEVSPAIYKVLVLAIKQGVLVPQLHGLEHLNGQVFAELCQHKDPRVAGALANAQHWNWETLDSPLQGHYIDGSRLPTQAISEEQAESIIALATVIFVDLFGYTSVSTVAPCYLWNSAIENIWHQNGIKAIQTAGYRCDGRDEQGTYHQDRRLLRTGDLSESSQLYLVRNVMYEPVDGNTNADTAYQEAMSAYAQALPISISTHRYNYTRGEDVFQTSLQGLAQLLSKLNASIARVRFLSSPELAEQIAMEQTVVINHFNDTEWLPLMRLSGIDKLGPFLWRLYYRHPKLVWLAYMSGLIIPASLLCRIRR